MNWLQKQDFRVPASKGGFSLGTVFTEGPFQELANILGSGWSSVQNQKGQAKHGNGT